MKNKKNFTLLGIGALNIAATAYAIKDLKLMAPLKFWGNEPISKMVGKSNLYVIPAIMMGMCVAQVIYRLNTMDKPVTKGKLIEDGAFATIMGILFTCSWSLIYVANQYTLTNQVNITLPIASIIFMIIASALMGIFSTFPINKKGTYLGLVTKETIENDEVWRLANRFNGFTGFVSAIVIMLLSMYFAVNPFNWIYTIVAVIICSGLTFVLPRIYAKKIYEKRANIVIE